MSSHARAAPPPGALKKRKDRADEPARPEPPGRAEPKRPAPTGGRLLAGYLAHEFLTRGTLLGRRWEPVRPNPVQNPVQSKPDQAELAKPYAEVSALLMQPNGAHIPGVVNPAQLAGWLRM